MMLNLFFPRRCSLCASFSRENLCDSCKSELSGYKRGTTPVGLACGADFYSPLQYKGLCRKAVTAFKLDGRLASAGFFIELMRDSLGTQEFDYVTWVPMRAYSLYRRAYHPAKLLARGVARLSCTKPRGFLKKIRRTAQQKTLTGIAARAVNVRGAYVVKRGCKLAGKRILLVDDVCTSGATMNECAMALIQAGATVVCLSAACPPSFGSDRQTG